MFKFLEEKQRKFPAPNLTVKRSFTARNTGALPITVQGFYISGLPCEGYGFRVLNCDPFYLGPNSTRKVRSPNCVGIIPVSYTHLDVYKRQIFYTFMIQT